MGLNPDNIKSISVVNQFNEYAISWTTFLPRDTFYQVYINHRLSWSGNKTSCVLPIPSMSIVGNVWIEVEEVDVSERFSSHDELLDGGVGFGSRAVLNWLGGSYLDTAQNDNVLGFLVTSSKIGDSDTQHSSVSELVCYPGSWISDGYGLGSYGTGGFGRVSTFYSWTSNFLSSGVWSFAVSPIALNGETGSTATVTVLEIPESPLAPQEIRLDFVKSDLGSNQLIIQWRQG